MSHDYVKRPIGRSFEAIAAAALDNRPVSGWTHSFYRYPARFSPIFAEAAVREFSAPGDLVLDPYMGGGTSIVEGMIAGRHMVGNDLNSLAAFVARVKTTPLRRQEILSLERWVTDEIKSFRYDVPRKSVEPYLDPIKTRNLSLPRARFLKKVIAVALQSICELPTENARAFARCGVLRVAQWALDGRRRHTGVAEFRVKLTVTIRSMLTDISELDAQVRECGGTATLLNMDTADLRQSATFRGGRKAMLVITSPPYPGVHMLYHRWQVDGRCESPAPYWIAGCNDGQGASYYNFAERRAHPDRYFNAAQRTLRTIHSLMHKGAHIVQLIAFKDPLTQFSRYMDTMHQAGFTEVLTGAADRVWRRVPNRKWHATLRGNTHSANEVVLIHRAV